MTAEELVKLAEELEIDDELDELVRVALDNKASAVNQAGVESHIELLLAEGDTPEAVERLIRTAAGN